MASSGKIGSFRPLTFLHSNKPLRPYRPQAPNRAPGMKGIQMSGDTSYGEFASKIKQINNMSPLELGSKAVELQKSSGISINVTI